VFQSIDEAWQVSKDTVSRTGEIPLKRLRVLVLTAELRQLSAAHFRIDFADDFLPGRTLAAFLARLFARAVFRTFLRLHRNALPCARATRSGADRKFGSPP
jgi:hypothetical protein